MYKIDGDLTGHCDRLGRGWYRIGRAGADARPVQYPINLLSNR